MGAHNRITRIRYDKIKSELKTPKDDKKVIEKYKISKTTARYIRNSNNYRHYLAWSNPRKRVCPSKKDIAAGYVDRKELERFYYDLRQRIDDIERKEVKIATFKLIFILCILLCLVAMSVGFIIERFGV